MAYKAILNGYDALFTTAAEFIEDLSVAAERGGLHEALKQYVAPEVLVNPSPALLPLTATVPEFLALQCQT